MQDPVATLNSGDDTVGFANRPIPRKGGAMKFAYASGARPLDGYTIKRGIGIGGFGEVYFATSDAGKEVAIKRIQRNLEVEVRGVTQCLNLKHPNLIALFDIKYDDAGEAWVVMEYVPGESLKDVCDRHPEGLPLDEGLRWFEGIAQGVAYLHDHGIVHRDLKPGNIFADDAAIKIGDYGLSKFISCSRRSGQTESVGTFHYMAPEIGKGVYGKEIDIYALGIILHEMLTGRVPFEGESSQEIIMKHLTADPDLSGIAQPYREVIRRSLLKDPEQRYSTVEEMIAALKGEATSEPVAARRSPAPSASVEKRVPPVVMPQKQTIFIGDEEVAGDDPTKMVFGPVKQRPEAPAAPAAPVAPADNPTRRTASSPAPVASRAAALAATRPTAEPLARGVRRGGASAVSWWSQSKLATPFKVLVIVLLLAALIAGAEWWIPLAVIVAAGYLVYYGGRLIVQTARKRAPARDHDVAARAAFVERTKSERIADWVGSLLISAAVAGILSFGAMALSGRGDNWVSFYAWMAATATVGSWMMLTLGKFWEGSATASPYRRRLLMLGVGVAIGCASWGLQEVLMVNNPAFYHNSRGYVSLGAFGHAGAPFVSGGVPTALSHVGFFGLLFAILSWWKQIDPLRPTRISLWSTALCLLWGLILPFPAAHGLALAGILSIAVQLPSPWINHDQRMRAGITLQEA